MRRDTRVMDKQLTDMLLEPGTRDIGADRGATVGIGPGTASETEIEIEIGTDETATEKGTRTAGTATETAAGRETEKEIVTVTEIEIETDGPDETAAYPPAERDIEAGAAAGVGADEALGRWSSTSMLCSPFCVCAFYCLLQFGGKGTVLLTGFLMKKEEDTLDNGGKEII